jgi:hypothetical protein
VTQVLRVLETRGLVVHGIDAGPRRLTALLRAGQLGEAQRALHDALIAPSSSSSAP